MHVLHVIDGLGLGGAERMLVDLANETVRDGHRVTVCVTRNDTTLRTDLDERIEVVVLGRRTRISPRAGARLAYFVRTHAVDVIHAHLRSNLLFVLPLRATWMIRTPIVFHDHFGTIEVDTSTPMWFRLGHRFIAHYVGVYGSLCEWARRAGVPAEKTSTIPNALDLGRLRSATPRDLRAELGVPPQIPLAVVVATVRRDKDLETLLDGVAELRGKVVVAVAGADGEPDYVERVRAKHAALGLDDGTVRFLGGRTDVPAILPSVDFAILSSKTESGPLVLIEYLAAELPIVATRVGDIGRYLADQGVEGFVDPEDPVALGSAISRVVSSTPAERRARGARGRAVLTERFDLDHVMPTWYALYDRVIREAA